MVTYKALSRQVFSMGKFTLVPLRYGDRYDIMKWRNKQIYHLRQNKLLSEKEQDNYFKEVVSKLFVQVQPNQILFSYLEGDTCIGYGGLVHINWVDRNAELSFIMDTSLEEKHFEFHWINFIKLIEKVAFEDLDLHKIFTYAFDLRPKLYVALEKANFKDEARLGEHCLFEGRYIDVLIHSKTNKIIFLRDVSTDDLDLTFQWANNPDTRKHSINKDYISKERHDFWFESKLTDVQCIYQILMEGNTAVGSIRVDLKDGDGIISYLIDPNQYQKGLGKKIVELILDYIKLNFPKVKKLIGFVDHENIASKKIFEKLGFQLINKQHPLLEFQKELIYK
ncbi:GNAT family N-acetyltransferase [Rhodonellum sp.]|uniref:GNAT family N-acetyltransferase n=1 Tax=Rhodonellum sp. TaxID=2231180 RepID=UPI0027283153|nr:GNAT family N-acetyltransferase [Rhodonellum sp.]MDO9551544.1 GNAT family N-acetyltransferase [Rhodonellum sp.]